MNVYKNNKNLRDNYKLSIYFKGDPTEEQLNNFEKKLLEMPEVRSLKYESKEVALRELENQLGIRVPSKEAVARMMSKTRVSLTELKKRHRRFEFLSLPDFAIIAYTRPVKNSRIRSS